MENMIAQKYLDDIREGICQKYSQVSINPEGQFQYPTGRKGLETLRYARTLIDILPEVVASAYCGVGNPFSLGKINSGEKVLDIGCGAGVDTILASMMVGPEGSAVGVDLVPEMIARAESNLKMLDINNVTFQNTSGEDLPFPDSTFDVVISNGAINLIPNKERALTEIIRVLKPGGRFIAADQIAVSAGKTELKARLANWFQ